jgi:cupin 2 domain-containing protein
MNVNNIYKTYEIDKENEIFDILFSGKNVKIEKISSFGQVTPHDDCYDQSWDEWVLVLKGNAVLRFFEPMEDIIMHEGDFVFIPSHKRHRVEYTDPEKITLWLAIHIFND